MTFSQGERVRIKSSGKTGTVAYQRMAPPYYREASAVSVVLDEKRNNIGYNGTMFAAEDVEKVA